MNAMYDVCLATVLDGDAVINSHAGNTFVWSLATRDVIVAELCVCVHISSCDSGQCLIEGSAILSLFPLSVLRKFEAHCASMWHDLKKICLAFIAAATSTRNGMNPVKSIGRLSITGTE